MQDTRTDAIIRELEEQRSLLGTRAIKFAGEMAVLQSKLLKAQAEIRRLESQLLPSEGDLTEPA
ncbi:MAG: hypothetical protein MJA84_00705 [Firmicutes bacterium]|nr:hypothetical protein [Bacillota bacterium]